MPIIYNINYYNNLRDRSSSHFASDGLRMLALGILPNVVICHIP